MNKNRRAAQSAFFRLRLLIAFLVLAAVVCSMTNGTLLALFGSEARGSKETLTSLPNISEGRPDCVVETWVATNTASAPSARRLHTAVWTGTEMIVWGGYEGFNGSGTGGTGGRYNPVANSWIATSNINAPTSRGVHTAVWTGSEMIVWGGIGFGYQNTGARYNPTTDTWVPTNTINAPEGRGSHTAVWTGSEMIIWGATILPGL